MHIYSAAFYVCAGNGLVPLVLIISSFVLLNVTGMVWLVAVTLLAHHTGRRGGGLPIGGGGLHRHLPLAWACIAVLRYEGLLYFFADLSIVLGFPISFYGIATCLLGVFAAMRFYCCMPRRGDDAVVFFSLVGGSSGRGVS